MIYKDRSPIYRSNFRISNSQDVRQKGLEYNDVKTLICVKSGHMRCN